MDKGGHVELEAGSGSNWVRCDQQWPVYRLLASLNLFAIQSLSLLLNEGALRKKPTRNRLWPCILCCDNPPSYQVLPLSELSLLMYSHLTTVAVHQ